MKRVFLLAAAAVAAMAFALPATAATFRAQAPLTGKRLPVVAMLTGRSETRLPGAAQR